MSLRHTVLGVLLSSVLAVPQATASPQASNDSATPSAPARTTAQARPATASAAEEKQPLDRGVIQLEQRVQDLERFTQNALDSAKAAADRMSTFGTWIISIASGLVVVLLAVVGLGAFGLKNDVREASGRVDAYIEKHDRSLTDLRTELQRATNEAISKLETQLVAVREINARQEEQIREMERVIQPADRLREDFERTLHEVQAQYLSPQTLKMWTLSMLLRLQNAEPDAVTRLLADEMHQLVDDEKIGGTVPQTQETPSKE